MPEKTDQPAEWIAPRLERLGSIGEITAASPGSSSDNTGSSSLAVVS